MLTPPIPIELQPASARTKAPRKIILLFMLTPRPVYNPILHEYTSDAYPFLSSAMCASHLTGFRQLRSPSAEADTIICAVIFWVPCWDKLDTADKLADPKRHLFTQKAFRELEFHPILLAVCPGVLAWVSGGVLPSMRVNLTTRDLL